METRFKMLTKSKPEEAKYLWKQAQHDADVRYRFYEYLAQRKFEKEAATGPGNGKESQVGQETPAKREAQAAAATATEK